jgi:hypothetical protein
VLVERAAARVNVVPLALAWRRPAALATEPIVRRVPIVAPAHARFRRTLDLAELLGAPPRGAWHVRVVDAAESWRDDARLLQVTDLAPVVRARPDGLVVSVASLADGLAVAGARVTAFTAAAHPVAEGRTDGSGLFVARGLAAAPAVVVVAHGDDLAWVDLDDHEVRPDARRVEDARRGPSTRGCAPTAASCARADRPRGRDPPHADGPRGRGGPPVVVTLRGPDGRVVRRVHRRTPASGLVDAALVVPDAARTGAYAVEVATVAGDAAPDASSHAPSDATPRALARTTVRVEPFVPDRIEAKVRLPDAAPSLGEVVPVRVEVRLFAARPRPAARCGCASEPCRWTCPRSRVPVRRRGPAGRRGRGGGEVTGDGAATAQPVPAGQRQAGVASPPPRWTPGRVRPAEEACARGSCRGRASLHRAPATG